jgi:hypothetical protein
MLKGSIGVGVGSSIADGPGLLVFALLPELQDVVTADNNTNSDINSNFFSFCCLL